MPFLEGFNESSGRNTVIFFSDSKPRYVTDTSPEVCTVCSIEEPAWFTLKGLCKEATEIMSANGVFDNYFYFAGMDGISPKFRLLS